VYASNVAFSVIVARCFPVPMKSPAALCRMKRIVVAILALMDLLSLVLGFAGTLCLALAVGVPPGSAGDLSVGRKTYGMAYMFPGRWWWGIALIIVAFVLQTVRVVLGLIGAK
jgi:hypothetical protein